MASFSLLDIFGLIILFLAGFILAGYLTLKDLEGRVIITAEGDGPKDYEGKPRSDLVILAKYLQVCMISA